MWVKKNKKKHLPEFIVSYFHEGDAHSTKNHVYHLSAELRYLCVNSPLHLGTGSRSIHWFSAPFSLFIVKDVVSFFKEKVPKSIYEEMVFSNEKE